MCLERGISFANDSSLDLRVFLVRALIRLVQILLDSLQSREERTKECWRFFIRLSGSFRRVEGLDYRPNDPDTLNDITSRQGKEWCAATFSE